MSLSAIYIRRFQSKASRLYLLLKLRALLSQHLMHLQMSLHLFPLPLLLRQAHHNSYLMHFRLLLLPLRKLRSRSKIPSCPCMQPPPQWLKMQLHRLNKQALVILLTFSRPLVQALQSQLGNLVMSLYLVQILLLPLPQLLSLHHLIHLVPSI